MAADNPWARLIDGDGPFVLPEDAPALKRREVLTDLWPEPYLGRPDAPVIVLSIQPGFVPQDALDINDPHFRSALRRNIRHESMAYLFFPLDPAFAGTGAEAYWGKTLKSLVAATTVEQVAQGVFALPLLAYRTANGRLGSRLRLPSQAYAASLLRDGLERHAVVIGGNGRAGWEYLVPELADYPVYWTSGWRTVSVSPRNVGSEGFSAILAALR